MSDVTNENLTLEEVCERLGRTKRLILIEISKEPTGYKKLSKKLKIGLDTIRSHVKTGKHSKSLVQLQLIERQEEIWAITDLGKQVLEIVRKDPEYSAYFLEENSEEN